MSTPAKRPPQRPTAQPVRRATSPSPTPSSGGSNLIGALKIFAALGVIGGGGWFAYLEYQKRNQPAPVVAETPKSVEKLPEPEVVPDPKIAEPDKPVVTEKPAEPEKPAEEAPKLAPLPALPSLERTEALAALTAATKSRLLDGRWADHRQAVKAAAILAINERPRTAGAAQLDKVSEKQGLPLGLAQLDLITALGEKSFAEFAKPGDEFAERLLTTPEAAELFLNSLAPEDNTFAALRVWKSLDALETKPENKARYRNLAVALALIHDKPGNGEHVAEIYAYYRKADGSHKLYTDFSKIKPDELVWGVADDSGVNGNVFGLDEREWALKNLSYPAAKLGDAYGSIPYRMNHAPYPEYTMANVLKIGGICWNQAKYSESNARARGVPGAYVSGEGSRGGHAWFAYKSPKGWVNNVGRYGDGYACGHASNPQTGKSVREWDFFLFDDEGRRNGDREAALRLVRAAGIVTTAEDRLGLLESAARRNPENPAAWTPWVNALLEDKTERPVDFWQKIVNEYRIRVKRSPDFFTLSDRIEDEKIFPKTDPDRVAEFLRKRRRQSIRENPMRFDLLTDSVKREADYYRSRKDDARVRTTYANALREYGDNLPAYVRLAMDFSELAADNPEIRKAGLSVMESVFIKDVDSKLQGDTFALEMQAGVAKRLAAIFTADGNEKKAERYAKRAEVIGAKAKELRDAMK
jgi:hypothetical protein